MKLSEAYPSAFLKADDLNGRAVTVTIESVKLEEIGQGRDKDKKLVISFVGKEKKLVCNKTNAGTIGKLHGDDTDDWEGKQIILQPREVEFQGDMVWSIRVSLQKPGTSLMVAPGAVTPRETAPLTRNENLDEDVPF